MNLFQLNPAKTVLIFACAILTMGTFSSCQKGGCTDPMSDNYDAEATKDDGSCVPWRDKFLGSFQVDQTCTGDSDKNGTLTATESSTGDNKVLFSFDGLNIAGTVATSTSIIIENQTVTYQGQSVEVSGSGSLTEGNTSLTLDFNLKSGAITSVCGISGTKL